MQKHSQLDLRRPQFKISVVNRQLTVAKMKVVAILVTVGFLATVVSEATVNFYTQCYLEKLTCEGPSFPIPPEVDCCDIGGKSYELPPPAIGCVTCPNVRVKPSASPPPSVTCYKEVNCKGIPYVLPPGTPPGECCRIALSYKAEAIDPHCTTCIFAAKNYRFGRLH